jgi:hypothetical protein
VQQWFSRRESLSTDADGNKKRIISLGLLPEAYGEAETSGLRMTVTFRSEMNNSPPHAAKKFKT